MKRILALLMMMCMAVGVLASCGGGSSYYDDRYAYIEDLAKAIDEDDEDRIDEICDDISAYWEEYSRNMEDMMEDLEDKYADQMEEMEDLESDIDDADIKDSAREAIDEAMDAFESAMNVLQMANPDELEGILETMIDGYIDIAEAAEDEDSDKVKDIARDLKDEFEAISDEYEEYQKEYEDKLEELRDEYGDDVVNEAMTIFSSSLYM